MSETDNIPKPERIIEELLRAADEMERRERERYLPFNMIPDPRVRSAVIMLARKYADMTENFAQGLARRAESYGVMMVTANMEKPTEDGVILVVKFQIVGVRGDILKARYQALRKVVKMVKGYKSANRFSTSGEMSESGSEPGYGGTDSGSHTSPNSKEAEAEGYSEGDYGSGPDSAGDSEGSGRVIVM